MMLSTQSTAQNKCRLLVKAAYSPYTEQQIGHEVEMRTAAVQL